MSTIVVENLCKRFGDFVAVDSVSFEAKEGELVALLGPSGSGKSTILRIIAGLEVPDQGRIFLDGKDVTKLLTRQRQVGFVFQHYALFKHMTVERNIAFGLEILKRDKTAIKEKVTELINLVNLHGYEKHYPDQLSGGQRQRVALARALAPEPRIMLLDEPFGSLDAKVRENLANWIRALHRKINVTSIFVTHDQSEAIRIADKIVAINRGRVEQIGTAKEVYENPNSKFVASFIGNTNVISGEIEDNRFHLENSDDIIELEGKEKLAPGLVVLLVRPEDIIISTQKSKECPIKGILSDVFYQGSYFDINISVQHLKICAQENKKRFLTKKINQGDEVFIGFDSYSLFHAPEGHDEIREKLSHLGYIE